MINAIRQYYLDIFAPRWRRVVFGGAFIPSLIITASLVLLGDSTNLRLIRAGNVIAALLTYASIALGFTLAGMTLVLTLPNRAFARRLANQQSALSSTDAYSDLLFVFSWTSLLHWVLVCLLMLAVLFAPPETRVFSQSAGASLFMAFVVTTFFGVYGILQFLVTIITLTQVGFVFVGELKIKGNSGAGRKTD